MVRSNRGLLWVALVLLAAVCGCDIATMSYFLMPEPRQPPQLKRLASDDKKVKKTSRPDGTNNGFLFQDRPFTLSGRFFHSQLELEEDDQQT